MRTAYFDLNTSNYLFIYVERGFTRMGLHLFSFIFLPYILGFYTVLSMQYFTQFQLSTIHLLKKIFFHFFVCLPSYAQVHVMSSTISSCYFEEQLYVYVIVTAGELKGGYHAALRGSLSSQMVKKSTAEKMWER